MDPSLEKAMMPVEPVARAGLQALARGRSVVVPGTAYRVMTWLTRMLPDSWGEAGRASDGAAPLTRTGFPALR